MTVEDEDGEELLMQFAVRVLRNGRRVVWDCLPGFDQGKVVVAKAASKVVATVKKAAGKPRSTPTQRALQARAAAHQSWANTSDPAARTAPARKAAMSRFEQQVDPDGSLPVEERTRRAKAARKAHYTGLALKSARVRASRKPSTELER